MRKKIAVLDDEPIVCERLKPALEKAGFEVATFVRSQHLIDNLSQSHFDVVITDMKMHKPDGLDVVRFVQQHSPSTKVIIITGFATVETAKEALKSGAVDFIAKPFKIGTLKDLVIKITSS